MMQYLIFRGHTRSDNSHSSQLSKEEDGVTLDEGCILLEVMVFKIFQKLGWRYQGRT